jgi:glutamyl-tRNA reductase
MSSPVPFSYHVPLSVVGMSFRTVSVSQRERAAPNVHVSEILSLCAARVNSRDSYEAVLLSTCNRCEYYTTSPEAGEEFVAIVNERLGATLSPDSFYRLSNRDAVRHLFRVASSLDSMVLGEPQILAQVKEAYELSIQSGFAKKIFHRLFQLAFNVAKKTRERTGIGEHGVSVSSIAIDLAHHIIGDLKSARLLIIGSGRMAELCALHARGHGATTIAVCNRTLERAIHLASLVSGEAYSLDSLDVLIQKSDIIIGSITIDRPLVEVKNIRSIAARRPLFFLDLGVPRNFPEALRTVDNVILYNIDDLQQISLKHRELRQDAAHDASVLIDYSVHQFEKWLDRVIREPWVLRSREWLDALCQDEVRKVLKQMPEYHKVASTLASRLSAKLSHYLILDPREDEEPLL